MEGKIALEEHFSTQMNNHLWDGAPSFRQRHYPTFGKPILIFSR